MPLTLSIEIPEGKIALWKIEEDIPLLQTMCKPEEIEYALNLSAKRAKEFLAWHALLHQLSPEAQTSYDKVGAPLVSDCAFSHIGVSHGGGYVAVIIGTKPCAVDVEDYSRDFTRAASRFVSNEEKVFAEEAVPLIWCAKECMYKWKRAEGVDMLTQMNVTAINHEAQTMKGTILGSQVSLRYIRHENIYMVFCI